jgi:predicted metalloprotease with PDZ domain
MHLVSKALFIALLVPSAMAAQEARSAPISNIVHRVTFNGELAGERALSVAMSFDVAGAGAVLLSLPAWTPGAYEISNFARYVSRFGARSPAGPLRWEKFDHDTWRVDAPGAGRVTVEFRVRADTLDNAMSWTQTDFALFNGTTVFLYPEGQSHDTPARVEIETEPEWRVATGMTRVNPQARPFTFSASSYHDLVDMPFFVGRFDIDSVRISGRWTRMATYPVGAISGAARAVMWDQIQRMIPPQVAVFGEVPWEHYTILQIADTSYQGASGLEHQNSHVNVFTPLAIGSEFLPSLLAHEIFHAWNVKRLRPAELWPYAYDRKQPTALLWMSEGVTDYYADLSLVRGGVVPPDGFYAALSEKMNEVLGLEPVALEDASLSTWVHPTDGTMYVYYPKGALAGFMLDVLIRDATDNRRSLDHVMRELYAATYKRGRGFTNEEWWATVNSVMGPGHERRLEEFHARYVDGREPYPWEELLPLAGLRLEELRVPRFGISTAVDGSSVVVTDLEEGSAAAVAGVRVGDVILAIGDISIDDPMWGQRFRAFYEAAREGAPVAIRVRRGAQTLTLQSALRFSTAGVAVVEAPDAPARPRMIRAGILGGTTAR